VAAGSFVLVARLPPCEFDGGRPGATDLAHFDPLLAPGHLDVDGISTTMCLDEAANTDAAAASRSGADVKILLTP
jgi:hypothetical protein